MKNITSIALAGVLGCVASQAAVTEPVGYTTSPLVSGFNIIGVNLHSPVSATGTFETISGTSLTDSDVDFTAALAAGQPHTLRITSGGNAGINTGIASFAGDTIVTDDDISGLITTSDTYEIRKTLTVQDVFGAANEAGLAEGNNGPGLADKIWVQTSSGFDQVYYNGVAGGGFGAITVGWRTTTGGDTDASQTPIYFTDAIFVEVVGAGGLSLTFTGNVITDDSVVPVANGFNYQNRILPVGTSLGDSGLEAFLTQGNNGPGLADIIWISNGSGGYDQYYYNGTAGGGFGAITVGWRGTTTGDTDQSAVDISDGFIIERKTAVTTVVVPGLP